MGTEARRFRAGKSSPVLKGVTTGGPSESGGMKAVTYVLRARAEQLTMVSVRSPKDTALFSIYAPGMQLMEDAVKRRQWIGQLPKTGDYQRCESVSGRPHRPVVSVRDALHVRDEPELARWRQRLRILAAAEDSEYDGWTAAAVK